MAQTLIYENRKCDPVTWDISTADARAKGFLELFCILRDEWQVYTTDYWGDSPSEQKEQKRLYALAESGDGRAAERLLQTRKDYEYEEWIISP